MEAVSIQVRKARDSDMAYVATCWLKSIRTGTHFAKHVPPAVFFRGHKSIAERILSRSNVLVAHPDGDEDTIVGYLIYETTEEPVCIHWVYVRSDWRRVGIAKRLVAAAGINVEGATYALSSFDAAPILRKLPGLTHNPYRHFH